MTIGFSFNKSFGEDVIGESFIAMGYGFDHCHYTAFRSTLEKKRIVLQTLGCSFGMNIARDSTTIDGRVVEKIPYETGDVAESLKRMCKATITDLVLENVKRDTEGLPLIPLLFVVDIEGNRFPVTAESLSSKTSKTNHLITYSELRRCYKLANTFENKKVKKVAKNTFKFLKLEKNEEGKFSPVKIPPVWESEPELHELMQLRKIESDKNRGEKVKKYYWREELNNRLDLLDIDEKYTEDSLME